MAIVGTATKKGNVNDAVQGGWVSYHQVNYQPAALAAATKRGDDITVPGVKVGDLVFVQAEGLDSMLGVVGSKVTATDVVTLYLQNFYDATTGVTQSAALNVNIVVLHKS